MRRRLRATNTASSSEESLAFSEDLEGDREPVEEGESENAGRPPLPADNLGMDARCPLKLKEYPTSFCPMAVLRLKALKRLDATPTEKEEDRLPGCPYSINHQQSCYCFFKYARDYLAKEVPHYEIAHLLGISEEEVYLIEKSAIDKFKNNKAIDQIKQTHHEGGVFEDSGEYPHHKLHLIKKK